MRDLIYDHVGIKEALCPVLIQFGNLQPRDLRSDSNMIVIGRNLAFNAARENPAGLSFVGSGRVNELSHAYEVDFTGCSLGDL